MGTKQSGVQLPTPDSEGAELLLSELLKSNPISVQPADPVKKAEFIKEQYAQYWEMLRQHTTLSWQIPALSTAAIVFFLGIDPSRILEWSKTPFMPAVVFIILGSFVGIMFIHHRRNILFIGFYENAIKEIEKEYGLEMQVHHSQHKFKGFQGISSSIGLSIFLLVLSLFLLFSGFYFLALVI